MVARTQQSESPDIPSNEYAAQHDQTNLVTTILTMHDILTRAQTLKRMELYDPADDFRWFASGSLDTSSFKGQYIGIWKKQVVASGTDAMEVENIVKGRYGDEARPAVVYIPKDEEEVS